MTLFFIVLALMAVVAITLATMVASLIGRTGFPLPPADRRIGCIDGLRGYLALAVMVSHFFIWVAVTRFGERWAPPSIHVLNQLGAGGVALFFMTTGLVFYPRILKGLRSTSWTGVYVTRAFRIMPLVIVSVAIVTAVIVLRTGRGLDTGYARAAAVWVSSWDEPPLLDYLDSGRINAYVLWSLWFEWVFYLLVLPVCAAAMDIVRDRELPTWSVPVGLLGVALGARVAARLLGHNVDALQYFPLFAIGMIAFECQSRPAIRSLLSRPIVALPAIAALAAGMTVARFPYGAALPLFAVFFVCVACGNSLGGVLRTRGALVLGECSFGIYLLHGILLSIQFVDGAALPASLPTAWLPALLPALAAMIVPVTAAAYLLIERPGIARGRRLAGQIAGRGLRIDSRELEVAP